MSPYKCAADERVRRARSAVLVLYGATGQVGPLAVTADTGEETLINRFPGGPFTAEPDADARRHLLPGGQETRCWTVKPTGGGSVELGLELSDPLEWAKEPR